MRLTQFQYYELARRQIADANETFMELVNCKENPLTREDLQANIRRRPDLWTRYAGFLDTLPSRYHFAFKCSYMGCVDYMATDLTGTFRATLRTRLGDYERSILNVASDPTYPEKVESAIGLLVRCVCDDCGGIRPNTIKAFNDWRAAEHESAMAFMRAHPERYGTEFNEPWCQPPTPVYAGRWDKETGFWTRVEESL